MGVADVAVGSELAHNPIYPDLSREMRQHVISSGPMHSPTTSDNSNTERCPADSNADCDWIKTESSDEEYYSADEDLDDSTVADGKKVTRKRKIRKRWTAPGTGRR